MTTQLLDLERWAPSVDPYARWIDQQSFHAARTWANFLNAGTPAQIEAAVAEAVAWDWLSHRVDSIELGAPPGMLGPDFRCRVGGRTFYVEVTNIAREVADARSGAVAALTGTAGN